MIRLSRTEAPEGLDTTLSTLTAKLKTFPAGERVKQARALWRSRRTARVGIKHELSGFAAGRDRCMYCGDNEGTDVDHYQPLALAPLLTFTWLNHLLACSTCNSHHKRDVFPLDAAGRPLLLDPTVDDPFEHLTLSLATGRYWPRSQRGQVTIDVCGLNRDILTRGRQTAFQAVTFMLPRWTEYLVAGDETGMKTVVHTIREQPFADVVQAMLRYASSPGAAQVFADRVETLDLLRNDILRAGLLTT